MSEHRHAFSAQEWPFDSPENTGAISCRHILEGSRPILYVTHDEDDGGWQFLCGEAHELEDARVVCLGCMVSADRSLAELADLPLGRCASRDTGSSSWVRALNPPTDDE